MTPEILLLDLGISFAKNLLDGYKNKTGVEIAVDVLDSGQAFIDALESHRADVLSKQNFDAQRG